MTEGGGFSSSDLTLTTHQIPETNSASRFYPSPNGSSLPTNRNVQVPIVQASDIGFKFDFGKTFLCAREQEVAEVQFIRQR